MIRITAPVPVTGRHWGLDFTSGHAETDNPDLAHKLASRGYTIETTETPTETPAEESDESIETEPVEDGPGTTEQTYICAVCGKVYKTPDGLKRHMARHEAAQTESDDK